jgi:alpha-1,3-glucosyltransferase
MVPNGDNPSTNKKANPLLQRNSYPEIVAPVPLRHHALQPELTPDAWIRTPSPSSSRAISPATPIRGGFPRGSRQHYRFPSFSTVTDARVGKGGPEVPMPLQEQGSGRRWLRWMHKNGVKHWVVPCTLLASVLVRWCMGLASYSGTLTKTACQRGWWTVLNLPPAL